MEIIVRAPEIKINKRTPLRRLRTGGAGRRGTQRLDRRMSGALVGELGEARAGTSLLGARLAPGNGES